MNTVLEKINFYNASLIKFLEIPIIKYGFLILVIIQIIMISSLSTSYLEIYDNNNFKVVYAFLIAYYACFDPIYAIALTTLMIISIQELHNRRSTNKIGSVPIPEIYKSENSLPKQKINIISDMPNKYHSKIKYDIPHDITNSNVGKVLDNDSYIYNEINKHALQKKPSNDDKLTGEYDFYNVNDPAYRTITDNMNENKTSGHSFQNNFITEDDLYKIESNQVPGANQNVSMQTTESQILNVQGLPNGYDMKSSKMEYVKNM